MPNRSKPKSLMTGSRIKELRIKNGMTQKELAEKLFKSESAIRMWELSKSEPDIQSINNLAEIFGVSPSYITGWGRPAITTISKAGGLRHPLDEDLTADVSVTSYIDPDDPNQRKIVEAIGYKKPALRVPVLGYVAAGIPIEAIEDIIDYEELDPKEYRDGAEYFGLQIKGSSMEPKFSEGDVVIVRKQPDVDSGQIGIVCINGDHATCKKIKKTPEGVVLISTNPAYEPIFYSNEEIASIPITILGRVVELRAKF